MGGAPAPVARPSAADTALADWARHYAAMLIVITIAGTVGSIAWGVLTTPRAEMWSIVVDTEQELPARQLGVVAETLFRAEETYGVALADLGLDWTPDDLFGAVELRSVPESRLLIVVAKRDDTYSASIVSDAMARALTDAFRASGYPGFRILGAPQPPTVSSTVSLPVFGALGAIVGLLVGLGLAVIHVRTRRPVLTLGAARALVGPADVISVPQRWGALGVLRRVLPTSLSPSARRLAIRRLHAGERTVALRWPGVGAWRTASVAATIGLDVDPDADRTVLVADGGSRCRELEDDRVVDRTTPITLLWLA